MVFTTYICSAMMEFKKPIPAVIKETKQDCLIWYCSNSGAFHNDVLTVVLLEGGEILHVQSNQLVIASNKTFNIKKHG